MKVFMSQGCRFEKDSEDLVTLDNQVGDPAAAALSVRELE